MISRPVAHTPLPRAHYLDCQFQCFKKLQWIKENDSFEPLNWRQVRLQIECGIKSLLSPQKTKTHMEMQVFASRLLPPVPEKLATNENANGPHEWDALYDLITSRSVGPGTILPDDRLSGQWLPLEHNISCAAELMQRRQGGDDGCSIAAVLL